MKNRLRELNFFRNKGCEIDNTPSDMYAQIIVIGEWRGEGRNIYLCLLQFNITLYLLCRGPKYHLTFMSPDPIPCVIWNRPKSHEICFPPGRKEREQSKESECITETPSYFEQNIQTNPKSVRGSRLLPDSFYVT